MPALAVTIDVPVSVGEAAVERVLAACSQAYPHGDCELSESDDSDGPRARISWLSSDRIELLIGMATWSRQRWIRRQLEFAEADGPEERYKAVGFAVGSIAGTVVSDAESAPESESQATDTTERGAEADTERTAEPLPAEDVTTAPVTVEPESVTEDPATIVISAAGQVSTALSKFAAGARVGVDRRLAEHWLVGLEFETRFAVDATPLTAAFYSPRIAVSFDARAAWVAFVVALSAGAEFIDVGASAGGVSDADFSVHPIVGLRPMVEFGNQWPVAPFIGAEVGLGRRLEIRSRQQDVAEMEALRWVGLAGARVRL